ncbi:predicted protein [Uncinocarpus reesii 1704]|uniref:Uncharacterized protein n=1 Tax=Uncinocarpus reesii (strain UAMH 1704) TaxID=336963 RepID=C4JY04_UNCRE|nr:uncharacterized protein UREG_07055 [Uncinocarpus reesii 1704]EEP82190.1 predicted protein [Uncinocarpus reesii 1704]
MAPVMTNPSVIIWPSALSLPVDVQSARRLDRFAPPKAAFRVGNSAILTSASPPRTSGHSVPIRPRLLSQALRQQTIVAIGHGSCQSAEEGISARTAVPQGFNKSTTTPTRHVTFILWPG